MDRVAAGHRLVESAGNRLPIQRRWKLTTSGIRVTDALSAQVGSGAGRSMKMRRYVPQLDGLRTIAVLLVIASHTAWIPSGYLGVDIFFALSGYLITTILLREHAEGRWSLKAFYLRRARRLYPALLTLLILGLPFATLIAFSMRHYVKSALIAAVYLSDFATAHSVAALGALQHTWSLSVEEQFYLVWPLALLGLLRLGGRTRWFTIGAVTAAMLVGLSVLSASALYLPFTRGGDVLVGCMLALALQNRPLARPGIVSSVSAAALAAVVVLAPDAGQPRAGLACALAALAATGLIAGLVHGGFLARCLSWKPLVWVGRRSYGVYLFHLPLLLLIVGPASAPHRSVRILAADVLASVALAALSYRLIELPFLRRNRLSVPTPPPAPQPLAEIS